MDRIMYRPSSDWLLTSRERAEKLYAKIAEEVGRGGSKAQIELIDKALCQEAMDSRASEQQYLASAIADSCGNGKEIAEAIMNGSIHRVRIESPTIVAEREACAQIADAIDDSVAEAIAERIRARGAVGKS